MNIYGRAPAFSKSRLGVQILFPLVGLALLLVIWPQNLSAYQDAPPRKPRRRPTRRGLPNRCSRW
jgi:hypothetical protein